MLLADIAKNRIDNAKEKTKKKLKKCSLYAGGSLIIIAGAAGALTAIIGLIASFVAMIFSGFTNQYRKDAVYSTITSYGSAYAMLKDNLLELDNSVDYEVIEKIFQYEVDSFDAYASTITAPDISKEDYVTYAKSASNNDESKSADDGTNTCTLIWNMNDFTYQFRTHWEYILTMSTIMCYEDDESIEKAMDEIGDDINDDGTVSGKHSLSSLVSKDRVDDAMAMITNSQVSLKTNPYKGKKIDSKYDLSSKVSYYTNYASDSTYKNATGSTGGVGRYGLSLESDKLITSIDFSKYCRAAYFNLSADYPRHQYDNFADNKYDYDKNKDTADCFGYTTNFLYNSGASVEGHIKEGGGNEAGNYAHVYYDGNLYPVCLIKEASNWLYSFYDFDYALVKVDDKNTRYVCTTYKKKYNIEKCIAQWEAFGIDKSLYEFIFDIMDRLEDTVGGEVSLEFRNAYDYYCENGKDKVIVYTNPAYSPIETTGTESIGDETAFANALTKRAASTKDMTAQLKAIWVSQDKDFKLSTRIGLNVANILYENNICYQPAATTDYYVPKGYYSASWSTQNYEPSHTPGGAASVYGFGSRVNDSSNGININEKIGLSSAGFIALILRYSVLKPQNCDKLINYPKISDIYNSSDFKFRDREELRIGDIAVITPDNDDENTNIIAYCVGRDGSDYVFMALNANANGGIVRKITLSDSTNTKYEKDNLTYFCRYYTGWNGRESDVIKEYTASNGTIGKQLYTQYSDISGGVAAYILSGGNNDIAELDKAVAFIEENFPNSGYTKEQIEHIASGILHGGVGDYNSTGISFDDDLQSQLLGGGLFVFPIHETYSITSWYGWRPGFSSSWHDGMDFGTPVGTNCYALSSGTVSKIGYDESSGNYLVIDYGDGIKSSYLHLSEYKCSEGDKVHSGSIVAKTGNSGFYYSSGERIPYPAHFHFKLEDGNTHFGSDMYGLFYMFGDRDSNHSTSIDPYLIFMDTLESWPNYSSEAQGNRPRFE